VENVVLQFSHTVHNLSALIDDILVQILRLGCQLSEHLEGLHEEVSSRHVKWVLSVSVAELNHLLLHLIDQLLPEVDLLGDFVF